MTISLLQAAAAAAGCFASMGRKEREREDPDLIRRKKRKGKAHKLPLFPLALKRKFRGGDREERDSYSELAPEPTNPLLNCLAHPLCLIHAVTHVLPRRSAAAAAAAQGKKPAMRGVCCRKFHDRYQS